MAETIVSVVVKALGGNKLKALNTQLKGTAAEAVKAGSATDALGKKTSELTGKLSKSGQEIRRAANGLEFFIDKAGRARKVTGQFVTTAEAAEAGIKDLGNEAKRSSGKVDKLGGAVRNLFAALATIETAKFIFIKTAELERTEKQLATVLGGLDKSKQVIQELQVINKQSPFSLLDLADTAKRLAAFGIEGDKVVSVTKQLGQLAAATGSEVNGLALAYGQVAAKGKLQTEELFQFQERGVPLLEELARLYGVSEAELSKLIQKGQVGFPAVEIAVQNLTTGQGKFAKAFENTADTLDAKLSNAIDALGRTAAAFGNLLKPEVIKFIEGFEQLLKETTETLKGIPKPISDAALKAVFFAGKVFLLTKALKVLTGLKAGIAAVLTSTATNATLAGNASLTAAGKVATLASRLKALAAIGTVVVGVEFLINSKRAGDNLEGEIQKLEAGGTGATFAGASRETVVSAKAQQKKVIEQIKRERKELTKPNFLRDLAGGIPVVGPLLQGGRGKRLQQLAVREANAKTVLGLDPKNFKSQVAAEQAELEKIQQQFRDSLLKGLDGGSGSGSGGSGGSGGGSRVSNAESLAEEALRMAEAMRQQLTTSQRLKDDAENRLIILKESTKQGKIIAEGEVERFNIQRDFKDKLEEALSVEEKINLKQAEDLELRISKREEEEKIKALKDGALGSIDDEIALQKAIIAGKEEEFKREKDIQDLVKAGGGTVSREEAARKVDTRDSNNKLIKQAEKLDALYKGIGSTIENGIIGAIDAGIDSLINGTKDLGKALQEIASGVLKQIGNALLRFGLNSALGGLGGNDGVGLFSKLFPRAEGGPVSPDKTFLVGEKGPEIFVPNTSGTIIPNDISKQLTSFNPKGLSKPIDLEFFAKGGRPSVGKPAIVGEKGPELFIPDSAGTVIPNDISKQLISFGVKGLPKSVDLPFFAEGGRPKPGKPAIVGEKGPELFIPDSAGTVISNDVSKQLTNFDTKGLLQPTDLQFFADGGRPEVGKPAIVGEKGPELFIPDTAGTIVPNDEAFSDARNALIDTPARPANEEAEAFAVAAGALERNSQVINNRQTTTQQETSFNSFTEAMMRPGQSTVRFETVNVGDMPMVTREEALKIGAESAKAAEANVFSALRNKPSVRRSIGMK